MLHIINGESTAGTLRQSCIEGEKISFRDALICGPTPSEVSGDEWHRIRALHLSDYYQAHLQRFLRCKMDLGGLRTRALNLSIMVYIALSISFLSLANRNISTGLVILSS